MIRNPVFILSWLVVIAFVGAARGQAPAAEPPSDAKQLPMKPFTASFAKVTNADAGAGTLEYLVTKPVYETQTREVSQTITLPDGKEQVQTKTFQFTVCKCVPETRALRVDGVQLTNTAGKSMPLAEAMKRVDLKGRDVLVAMDGTGIDPYYLKFLAKDVLIIVLNQLPPSPPAVMPLPAPVLGTTTPPAGPTPLPVPVPAAPAIPVPVPAP